MSDNLSLDMASVNEALSAIIEKAKTTYNTTTYKQLAFNCIDLTTLNATDTETHCVAFTKKVNEFSASYPDYGNVAAICVHPNMVKCVENTLEFPEVNIAAVSGGFPASMTFPEIKVKETELAVKAGADEIDIVLSLSNFLDGKFEAAHKEITDIKAAMDTAHLKVILETGVLSPEDIFRASMLSMNAGADFIKTSTGKIPVAATPEAAYIMCTAIAYHYENTGVKVGFKPAGGIVTVEDALIYLAIVKEVLGDEWMTPTLFRLGASRLANNILSDLEGKEIKFF